MSELNPGIRETVAWLNSEGFETCDSGDGKTHDFSCDRPFPYVVIQTEAVAVYEEANRLRAALLRRGIEVHPISGASFPQIQATYDPADETAFIDLMHVDDAMLRARTRPEEGESK